jgi:hypothetical protein
VKTDFGIEPPTKEALEVYGVSPYADFPYGGRMRTVALGMLVMAGGAVVSCSAVPDPPYDHYVERDAEKAIICAVGPDCQAKWSRAVAWVAKNSETKIQTQTDQLIQTYNPSNTATTAYTVMKVAVAGDRYRIELQASCQNPFLCLPKPIQMKASFNRYVAADY